MRLQTMSLAAALSLAACGGGEAERSPDEISTIATNLVSSGKALPNASLESVQGDSVNTDSLLGRPLLINFWYSTCEPCRREMPALNASYMRHGKQVDFIGVNMYDSAVVAKNFAERYDVGFAILLDSRGDLVSRLGIALAPTTIFVDERGIIVHQESGEMTVEEIDDLIRTWFPT